MYVIATLGLYKQDSCICNVEYVWHRYSRSVEKWIHVYAISNMCGITTLVL